MPVSLQNFSFCNALTCPPTALPSGTAQCDCTTFGGRINDLIFLPCNIQPTQAELIDATYWGGLETAGTLKRMYSKGIGGLQKKNVSTADLGGCGSEEITEIVWQITWKQFCIDQSALNFTHEFASTLLGGAIKDYNVFVRPCADLDILFPIGKVSIVDFDMNLPENTSDKMFVQYEFNFKSLVPITPMRVLGLTALVPSN